MQQLKGYEVPGKEHHVCLLNRAIYRLRQSGCEWYEMLYGIMSKLNFKCCRVEHAVFYKYKGDDTVIITADMDNMMIAANSSNVIHKFKNELSLEVKIKELGDLHWLLGIKVEWDRKAQMISFLQCAYITKILEQFNLTSTNPLSTLLDPHHKLSLAQCPDTPRQYEDMKNIPYREAIGLLMYMVLGTRPDIMFAITFLS